MRKLRVAALLLAILSGVAAPAQLPFGRATPVAGYSCELFAEPLWLGNTGYGYRLEKGPPGSAALVVVSLQRQDQSLFGLQLYPSLGPGDVLATHAGTLDATGRAFVPAPLAGPEIPALAGFVFWAQAAVAAPTGLGSTQGVVLDVALHPMLAIGDGTHGVVLIDTFVGGASPVAGMPTASMYVHGVFGNGGRDLFVATNNGLFAVDTLAPVPTAALLLPGSFSWVAWDPVHRRLFATYPYLGTIYVIDGERGPGFGGVLAQLTQYAGTLALTADGRQLVIGTPFGTIARVDVDPASAQYLQPIPTAPSPVQTTFGSMVQPVRMAPDGSVVSVHVRQLLPLNAQVWRYDATADQWIDHDPALPGVQPLTSQVDPQLPTYFDFLPTRDGALAVLVASPTFAALAFDLGATTYTRHNLPIAPLPLATYVGITPSGRYLLSHQPTATASELKLVEIATGAVLPFLALTPAHNGPIGFAAWR